MKSQTKCSGISSSGLLKNYSETLGLQGCRDVTASSRSAPRLFKQAVLLTHSPLRAKTRLSVGKAAASEEAKRTPLSPIHPSPVGTGVYPAHTLSL
jgi:hypothetical protein